MSVTRLARIANALTPAKVYFTLGLAFGLAILAANPPFQAPDEYEHFFRIIQLSQGELLAVKRGDSAGGLIPQAIMAVASPGDIPGHANRKVNGRYFSAKFTEPMLDWSRAERGYAHFPHTVIYSPLGYLPQIAAVSLAKLCHLGPLFLLYAARLASLLTCLALATAAIRRLPSLQWSATLLMLSPTALYFFGSCAPDGILISGTLFIMATLAQSVAKGRPSQAALVLLLALGAVLPVVKFVYLPLSLLIPFLLWSHCSTPGARWKLSLAWGFCCLLPTLLWGMAMSHSYALGRHDIPIDPHAQARHMGEHPLDFLQLLIHSASVQCGHVYHSTVGVLGWNDCPMPRWFYSTYGIVWLALFIGADIKFQAPLRIRLWCGLAGIGCVALIYAALYAHWNSPGSTTPIDGMVGRYLYPALIAGLFALPAWPRPLLPPFVASLMGTLAGLGAALIALGSVVNRYYLS